MQRHMLKSKIHRATVTACNLHYAGSVTIDSGLMESADLLPGGLQRSEVDPAEPVERFALRGRVQQGLVRVLAVEIDQLCARRCELAGRRQPPVDVGPTPPRSGDGPRQYDLVSRLAGGVAAVVAAARAPCATGPDESALDPCSVGSGPDQHRVGASADQELDGVDDEGLAGAGLAGERRHPRAEEQAQLGDDPEIADGQFEDHPVT